MKANELRQKSAGDLQKELGELMKEQFNLRMQKGMGDLPKPHIVKQVRRDIARVKTILREMRGK